MSLMDLEQEIQTLRHPDDVAYMKKLMQKAYDEVTEKGFAPSLKAYKDYLQSDYYAEAIECGYQPLTDEDFYLAQYWDSIIDPNF